MIDEIFENLFKPASSDDLRDRTKEARRAAARAYTRIQRRLYAVQREAADTLLAALEEHGNYLVDVADGRDAHTPMNVILILDFVPLQGVFFVFASGQYAFGGHRYEDVNAVLKAAHIL